ncbi:uncharacterized protein LOC143546393 [Bidens hawaiensis]|uniref:uncharacterized protein LOC143546393 n=1 Tax=Bidens hawaiensis TaxID=980011 RepID=UPI00404B1BD6
MRLRAGKSSWEIHLEDQHSALDSQDIISTMPEDFFTHMMSLLPSSDKGVARLLSRKWLQQSAQYQTRLFLCNQRLSELEFPKVLNEDFRSLKHLSLKKCPGMRNLKLAHLKLETIYLAYCGTLKSVHLNTPNLQNLHFHAPRIGPCVLEFVNCKKLRGLNLVGVDMKTTIFKNCNENFPVLKILTLAGCDKSGCINISSNSILQLSLIRFNKSVGLNIDAPRLVSFRYNGTTVPDFQNIDFPGLSIAYIELYSNRYQKRSDSWFTRLVDMLRCLKHAETLEFYTTSETNLIIPTPLREILAPPLKEMFRIVVKTNSRSGSIVDLTDSMLWVCPRVTHLFYLSVSWGSILQLSYGELASGLPADLCKFCTSPSSRCWRHSVTGFTIKHSREEARQEVRDYLVGNLTTAERDDIDWALLNAI